MEDILKLLIDDFHERPLPILVARNGHIARVSGKADVITGMRRSGKTWFCYQTMAELLAHKVSKERILYLNFEDDRLLPFGTRDFQTILDVYYRKFPAFKVQTCYFYFDEIQRVAGWDHFVRRLLDTETTALCVTGSSSKLLSTEIAAAIRGRSMTTEMFPFSFEEYLRFHQVDAARHVSAGSRTRALLEHHLLAYLEIGGFPEVQNVSVEKRQQILRSYIDVVTLRDVIERYKVTNVAALRALVRRVLASPANRFSVNRLYDDFRSQGLACTKNDLYSFVDYFAEAYLFYPVPIHSHSEHIRRVNPSKMYVVDTGLLEAVTLRRGENRGAFLENLVYLHLRRQGIFPDYYLTKTGQEVDFIYRDPKSGARRLMQICWSLKDVSTREREVRALEEAMKETHLIKGTIVTFTQEGSPAPHIEVIAAWKLFLDRI